jgi:hypothetical protein
MSQEAEPAKETSATRPLVTIGGIERPSSNWGLFLPISCELRLKYSLDIFLNECRFMLNRRWTMTDGRVRIDTQRLIFVVWFVVSGITHNPMWAIGGAIGVAVWLWNVRDDEEITEALNTEDDND